MQDVATADGVARDHGDDGLRDPANQDLQVQDVESADALMGDLVVTEVAVVASDRLVSARAERVGTLTGQHDDTDRDVVAGRGEGVGELEEGLGSKGVAPLGSTDRDLGDALGHLIGDVAVVPASLPRRRVEGSEVVDRIMRQTRDHGGERCVSHPPHAIGQRLGRHGSSL